MGTLCNKSEITPEDGIDNFCRIYRILYRNKRALYALKILRVHSFSTGPGLYTRLQNGVDRRSRLVRVNESLDITNHRGACQPHRHEHHNKQIQYGCRQPCWRSPPIFGPYLLRPNGCIDQDVTWYGARPRPRRLCVRWGCRSPSPKRGAASTPKK